MRTRSRIVAVLLSAAAAVSAVSAGTPVLGATGTPEQTSYTVLQFNMCGNASHCPDPDGVPDAIVRSVTGHDPQPIVVTLNEVCANQLDYVVSELASYGYTGVHDPTGPTCGNGTAYGNALLVNSGLGAVDTWELPNPGGNEPRGLMCAAVEAAGFRACVTHISQHDEDQAEQIRAVADTLDPLLDAGERVLLGGDFNVPPDDAEISPLYGSCYPDGVGRFAEADSDPPCTRTGEWTVGTGKIDYVFFSEHFTNLTGDVTHSDYSDHAPVWATATL